MIREPHRRRSRQTHGKAPLHSARQHDLHQPFTLHTEMVNYTRQHHKKSTHIFGSSTRRHSGCRLACQTSFDVPQVFYCFADRNTPRGQGTASISVSRLRGPISRLLVGRSRDAGTCIQAEYLESLTYVRASSFGTARWTTR